jgi:hypothetical protein
MYLRCKNDGLLVSCWKMRKWQYYPVSWVTWVMIPLIKIVKMSRRTELWRMKRKRKAVWKHIPERHLSNTRARSGRYLYST